MMCCSVIMAYTVTTALKICHYVSCPLFSCYAVSHNMRWVNAEDWDLYRNQKHKIYPYSLLKCIPHLFNRNKYLMCPYHTITSFKSKSVQVVTVTLFIVNNWRRHTQCQSFSEQKSNNKMFPRMVVTNHSYLRKQYTFKAFIMCPVPFLVPQ